MSIPPRKLSSGHIDLADSQQVMMSLVRQIAEAIGADRCTLTSLDQQVFRVEASYEWGHPAEFMGREFSLEYMDEQPQIRRAVETRSIVTGGNLASAGRVEPSLQPALEQMQRTAVVPLEFGGSVGAVLILSRRADVPFAEQDLRQLQQFGTLAVLALRNTRLVEEVWLQQQRGLETLTMISGHIASSDEPPAFFGKMSETVARLAGTERAAFWRIDGGDVAAQPEAHGFSEAALAAARIPLPGRGSDSPIADLLYSGRALRCSRDNGDVGGDVARLLDVLNARDMLAVPWRTASGPIGMLAAVDSHSGFTDQDEWIVRLAARASALVWQGYEADRQVEQLQSAERERLQAHADRMAELERQKTEFLQLASHELRTPITLVLGYLSMLEEGALGQLPEPAQKVMPVMSSRMSQMNTLVDRMLIASRLEQSSRARAPKEIDVRALTTDVVEAFAQGPRAVRRFSVEVPEGIMVRADLEDVRTILTNLISNALKYSPEDEVVSITATRHARDVSIEVHDRGIGIGADDLTRLFRPFLRLESAQATGVDGTGLGLFLSRSLALANDGDITATSSPDRGTTFRVQLPAAA